MCQVLFGFVVLQLLPTITIHVLVVNGVHGKARSHSVFLGTHVEQMKVCHLLHLPSLFEFNISHIVGLQKVGPLLLFLSVDLFLFLVARLSLLPVVAGKVSLEAF